MIVAMDNWQNLISNWWVDFTGLAFFTKNDYIIQALFFFLYINMIISLAFLVSNVFRNAKTATGSIVNLFLLSARIS